MTIKDDRPNNLSKCAIINGLVLVYNIAHADLTKINSNFEVFH